MPTDTKTTLVSIEIEARWCAFIRPPFHSFHEAYAVIKEEMDELWDEIKRNPQDPEAIRQEAVHSAAMLVRLLTDLL